MLYARKFYTKINPVVVTPLFGTLKCLRSNIVILFPKNLSKNKGGSMGGGGLRSVQLRKVWMKMKIFSHTLPLPTAPKIGEGKRLARANFFNDNNTYLTKIFLSIIWTKLIDSTRVSKAVDVRKSRFSVQPWLRF